MLPQVLNIFCLQNVIWLIGRNKANDDESNYYDHRGLKGIMSLFIYITVASGVKIVLERVQVHSL